jgi:hypothetical protein
MTKKENKISPLLNLLLGTFVSFLGDLGQKSNLLCMLLCPNGP